VAVIVSLFTAGLKLPVPLGDRLWWIPTRLAFVSMTLTVGLVATALALLLDVHWGAAILIGAILAPTDPVLASAVQVRGPVDRDRLRFSLTAEAGLNDGTAFPFVMLGLGLLGFHEIGAWGWRWLAVDLGWAIAGGLGIGALLGKGAGELVLYLRRHHKEGFGYDEFLALGLIGLSYGSALILHTYGFLAVFAAGFALRSVERRHSAAQRTPNDAVAAEPAGEKHDAATRSNMAPADMTESLLEFNEQVERLIEVALVMCIGAMLLPDDLPRAAIWFIPLLLFVIRPMAVATGLIGSSLTRRDRLLISWLGIRGIGSVYYLMHAIGYGLSDQFSRQLVSLVILTVAVSIFSHGVSASPLMRFADRKRD
jgi:NhaP-type Na+/H+ or K+/H+ antiporter